MTTNRVGTNLSLSLAVAALCACITQEKIIWGCSFLVTFIVFHILTVLEEKIRASDGEFLNRVFYYVSKNPNPYVVNYIEVEYKYLRKNEMIYDKDLEIKSLVKNLKKYEDKYNWSSYGKNIEIVPKYQNQTINLLGNRNIWNVFEIDFHERVGKRKPIKTGIIIKNLVDELDMAKPFLALATNEKITERVMKVIIPKSLKPKNAKFEIYPFNNNGHIIKREELEYDESIGGYKKIVSYPRKGWIYSIVWEWDE